MLISVTVLLAIARKKMFSLRRHRGSVLDASGKDPLKVFSETFVYLFIYILNPLGLFPALC